MPLSLVRGIATTGNVRDFYTWIPCENKQSSVLAGADALDALRGRGIIGLVGVPREFTGPRTREQSRVARKWEES